MLELLPDKSFNSPEEVQELISKGSGTLGNRVVFSSDEQQLTSSGRKSLPRSYEDFLNHSK